MGKAAQWVKKEVGSKVQLSGLSAMAVKEVFKTRKVRACVLIIGGGLLLSLASACAMYKLTNQVGALQDKNNKLTNEFGVLQEKMKRVFKELGIHEDPPQEAQPPQADHHEE